MLRFFITAGILIAICQSSQAEDVQMFKTPPSAEEMGRILFPKEPNSDSVPGEADPDVKTRSISFGKKTQTPKASKSHKTHKKPAEKMAGTSTSKSSGETFGLPIEFAYNSSQISTESIPFLTGIGEMLKSPDYSTKRLIIEGHTDATGSDDYNRYLSKMRAEAIKKYLEDHYQIQANRLLAKGLGESDPLPGHDPNDAVNRRVQLRSSN